MLNKFNLQFGSLLFGSLLMLGCSGGGSDGDDNVSAAPDPDDVTVNGAAVKGPLIGADINAYIISPAEDGMRGRLIASGTTDANARLAGIEINTRRLDKAFLLEISGGTDHTTGADSLISPLSTLITAEGLANGQAVYATPLTSFVLAVAMQIADVNDDKEVTVQELLGATDESGLGAIDAAAALVKSAFGFGLLGADINLFTASPTLDDNTEQATTLAYRMASEAFAALILALEEQGSASAAEILQALAIDLADGGIDGTANGQPIPALQDIPNVLAIVAQDPAGLVVPGTSSSIADLAMILVSEAADLSPDVVAQSLTVPVLGRVVPGADSDGDGVIDVVDACPDDPNETVDSDNDGYCDGLDLFPQDGNDWADIDSDGFGDNADACDSQSGTSYSYGYINADGDALCALLPGDTYAVDMGIDYDDNNAAVDDICDAGSGASLQDQGDAGCFADNDGDGIPNPLDNCPAISNPNQSNIDGDAFGDVCDSDRDGDGVANSSDAFPNDPTGWLDCGNGVPATSCDINYELVAASNTNNFPAANSVYEVASGSLVSSDNGNTLSGNVSINLAAANTTTAYIVNFAYNANWIIDLVNKTITASNVVCVDRGGDPLVIGTTNSAFEGCGDGVAPEPGFVNFIQGVLSDTGIKAVNASGSLSITDNGAGTISIVFTTGDSVGNIYNFTLTY